MNIKPNWEKAPEWANWLARDWNGSWCWYEKKPIIDDEKVQWLNQGGEMEEVFCKGWENTLEERPNE